jgi:ABC-type Fe3+ transport system substrate-binding protein
MKRGVSTIVVALLILVIIVAAVAAYGWLRPTTTTSTYTPTTLEEKAYKEGGLTIYGVADTTDITKWVIPAFVAEYPWAAGMINYVGKSPADIATSALSEYKAGHVTADVLIDTLGSMISALVAGVAENYTNPMISIMNYSSGTYDANGLWTIGFGIPIVVVYNKNLVDASHVPTTWQNLTDPYWSGKIVLDDPKTLNVAGTLFAHLYPIMGNASWTTLMQGIAANNPIKTTSAGDSFTDVAQGTASIGVGLVNDYLSALSQPTVNVSVAWIPPVTSLPVPAALCANAPHPNFAKLFLNWFASGAGQYSIADTGRVPSCTAIAAYTILAGVLPPGTSVAAAAGNNPDYYLNPTSWSATYQTIFG